MLNNNDAYLLTSGRYIFPYLAVSIIVCDAVIKTAPRVRHSSVGRFRIKFSYNVGKTNNLRMIVRSADCRNVILPQVEELGIQVVVHRIFLPLSIFDVVKPYRTGARLVHPPPFDPGYTFHIFDKLVG